MRLKNLVNLNENRYKGTALFKFNLLVEMCASWTENHRKEKIFLPEAKSFHEQVRLCSFGTIGIVKFAKSLTLQLATPLILHPWIKKRSFSFRSSRNLWEI